MSLLFLSWSILIPQLTHIEIDGTVRSVQELTAYKADLSQQISSLKEKRSVYLSPVQNDVYSRLKAEKNDRLKFQHIRTEVREATLRLVSGRSDIVAFSSFQFNAAKKTVELRGEIHNVGTRSMTVLAQFIEEIDRIPAIVHIDASRFTREERTKGVFYSPFTIRFTIQ